MPPGSATSLPIRDVWNTQISLCATSDMWPRNLSRYLTRLAPALPFAPARSPPLWWHQPPAHSSGASLRRCDHCRSWFEANRKDARFCSGSCRSFHSQQKEKS